MILPRLLESRLEEISLSEKNHFSRKGYSFFAECKEFESWIDRIIQGIIGGGIATEVKSIKDWVPLQLPGVRIIQVAPYLRIKILGTKYYASPIVRPFFARYQQYGPPLFSGSYPESSEARPVRATINLGSFNALQPARSSLLFTDCLFSLPPSSSHRTLSLLPIPFPWIRSTNSSRTPPPLPSYLHMRIIANAELPFTINFIKSFNPLSPSPVSSSCLFFFLCVCACVCVCSISSSFPFFLFRCVAGSSILRTLGTLLI